jgi:PleD family two-component response regulator
MCAQLHGEEILTVTARGEFAALLPTTDRDSAIAVADALLGAIHRHEGSRPGGWRSSASIGLVFETAIAPLVADKLRDAADRALYDAQSSGHDRLAIYDARRHEDTA